VLWFKQVQVADGAELTDLSFGGKQRQLTFEFEDASFLDVGLGDFSFFVLVLTVNVEQGSTQYLLFADLGGSN